MLVREYMLPVKNRVQPLQHELHITKYCFLPNLLYKHNDLSTARTKSPNLMISLYFPTFISKMDSSKSLPEE